MISDYENKFTIITGYTPNDKISQKNYHLLLYMYRLFDFLYKRILLLYTKIEFIQRDLDVSRITAANYLNKLADDKLLTKKKLGTANYYINDPLFKLLSER